MLGSEILQQLVEKYSECRSYSDHAIVRSSHNGEFVSEFETYFASPSALKFLWSSSDHHGEVKYEIWSDRKESYVSYCGQPAEPVANISDELLSLDGFLCGASTLVPPLFGWLQAQELTFESPKSSPGFR